MSRLTLVVAMGCGVEEAQPLDANAERQAGIDVTQVGASVRITAPAPDGVAEVPVWVSVDGDEQELTAMSPDGFVDIEVPVDPCVTFGRSIPVGVTVGDLELSVELAMGGDIEDRAGPVDELTVYCDPGPYRVQVAVEGAYEVSTDGLGIVWSREDGAGWATSGGWYQVHVDVGTFDATAGNATYLLVRRM